MGGRIPVAVIGVGEHGKKHVREIVKLPEAELVGVFDIRPSRCREVADEFGVRAFSSLDEALTGVAALSLAIPTTEHAPVARQVLRRGLDLLVEKPITRTLKEADELIQLAAERGCILQVGHVERFNPGVVAAKAITTSPLFFEVHRLGVFSPRSLDVDVVFDLMIHDLDLVLWLLNCEAREVRAVGLPVLSDKVDIANARIEFENGAVANFTASRVSTERVRKFRYFQPDEYVSIDFTRRDAIVLNVERTGDNPALGYRKLEAESKEPLYAELAAFINSVRTRTPPRPDGREGRRALALAERVMLCIEEHAERLRIPLSRPRGRTGEV